MICPSCQREVEAAKTICPYCGRPLPKEHIEKTQQQWMNRESKDYVVFIIGAIIGAIVSIFFLPPLFGGVGFWCGTRVKKTNQTLGSGLMLLNVVCLVAGMIWGMVNYLN